MFLFCLFFSFIIFFTYFDKKIMPLLSLELMIISLISFYILFSSFFDYSFLFMSLIFLVFMVIDSVLGLSLLISISRCSSKNSFIMF